MTDENVAHITKPFIAKMAMQREPLLLGAYAASSLSRAESVPCVASVTSYDDSSSVLGFDSCALKSS